MKSWIRNAGLLLAGLTLACSQVLAQQELKIGYQPNPIQDNSIAMMEKWGAKNNVRGLCREDDGLADLWVGPVRRHLAQR